MGPKKTLECVWMFSHYFIDPETQNLHCLMLCINSHDPGTDGKVPSNLPFRCFDTLVKWNVGAGIV